MQSRKGASAWCPRSHARPHIVTHAVSSQGNPSSPSLFSPLRHKFGVSIVAFPFRTKGDSSAAAVGRRVGRRREGYLQRGTNSATLSLSARLAVSPAHCRKPRPSEALSSPSPSSCRGCCPSSFRLGTIFRPPLFFFLLETARKRIKRKTSRRRCYLLPEEGGAGRAEWLTRPSSS